MPNSPYRGKTVAQWSAITDELIANHPIKPDEIVETVLKSWNDIFNSKIGSFSIGQEIEPVPQIMSFLLHELVAHYLSLKHPGIYKVGTEKQKKTFIALRIVHCLSKSKVHLIRNKYLLIEAMRNHNWAINKRTKTDIILL